MSNTSKNNLLKTHPEYFIIPIVLIIFATIVWVSMPKKPKSSDKILTMPTAPAATCADQSLASFSDTEGNITNAQLCHTTGVMYVNIGKSLYSVKQSSEGKFNNESEQIEVTMSNNQIVISQNSETVFTGNRI